MKKHLLTLSVAVALGSLAGCSNDAEPTKVTDAMPEEAKAIEAAPAPKGKAELGSFGVDLTSRDETVKPGDDFFMYASGTWYKNYEMPADKTRYGAFSELGDKSRDQVKAVIDEVVAKGGESGSAEQMIADYYHAFMDVETLNKLGVFPIQKTLDAIAALKSKDELPSLWGADWSNGISSPFGNYIWADRKDPNRNQVTIGSGGLGLPDRDYYLEDNERFKKIRAAYVQNISEMLAFVGAEDAQQQAKDIMAFETKIATYLWPREKRRNRDLTLNQIDRKDLTSTYPGFDWDAYLAATGYEAPDLNISMPDAVNAAIALVNDTELAHLKSYMTYHLLSDNAAYLSEEVYMKNFEFYGKTLGGQQEPEPRWKRAIGALSGTQSLGFSVGKVYVKKYFPESSKAQMSELVENLRTALGQRIKELAWMGEETKVNAQAKLAAFRPKIGYPDVWPAVDGVEIKADDLIGNRQRLSEFFHKDSVAKQHEAPDRERWGMTPQRVNAYYNSSFNEIVFPAAILQAPFFDPNADAAVNYGAIGAVIGHEMGHGFDDQGSKSDAKGVQKNWWTDADRSAFEQRTDMLVKQYSAYEPIEGSFVNGHNSLGENIGDVGGIAMAYHAYKLSLNGQEAPVIDGLTGDQRFFLSWAQVWREKRTEESMMNQLRGGIHSPGQFRALAPRNHDAWYKAFNVQPGDKLYLAPEDRVRIW